MPTGTGPAYRANFDLFVNREATVPLAHEAIRAYHACTSFTDAQIGCVLATLDRLNLRDNTIIVLIADHGWHLGEKGMWAKLTLFEPSAHVPLIIVAPRMASGKGCSRIVESLDVYPTLTDLCGLKAPSVLEGKSLRPLLEDPVHPWDAAAYSFLSRGPVKGISVRTDQFRYTEWDNGQAGAELYDYHSDPTESRNLAQESSHAATVKKMKEMLRAA